MSIQAWDQQPNEPNEAYEAFLIYAGLPSSERSLLKASQTHAKKTGQKINETVPRTWAAWSKTYGWVKRVDLYDAHREAELMKYATQEQISELVKFRKAQRYLAAKVSDTALLLIDAAMRRLETLNPEEISPNVIPQYVKAAAAIAEMAADAEARALLLQDIVEAYDANFTEEDDAILENDDDIADEILQQVWQK